MALQGDVQYRAEVEGQIEALKTAGGNENAKQVRKQNSITC
jgi:hypothetical protein